MEKSYKEEIKKIMGEGFTPVNGEGNIINDLVYETGFGESFDSKDPVVQRLSAENSCMGDGRRSGILMGTNATMLDYPQQIMPIPSAGDPDLGYAVWGPANAMPSAIFKAAASHPFTASALDYMERTLFGLGPKVMYRISRYSGGTVTHEEVPYQDAEVYLRAEITRLYSKLDGLTDCDEGSPIGFAENLLSKPNETKSYKQKLVEATEQALERAQNDLEKYLQTRIKLERLLEDNNIGLLYKKWIADSIRLGICYPMIGLSRGKAGKWSPEIVRVEMRDACVMRLEERNPKNGLDIDHVYYSEVWRDDSATKLVSIEYVAYPCLMPEHALKKLKRTVDKNQRKKISERPYWFCCPSYQPSPTKPYYPQPSWWSVFPSQVYQYASTIIYDKASARRNSTMWGKILFINISYLQQIFAQAGEEGKTKEGQKKIRQGIYKRVEDFLRRRDNNGKLLVMDSYPSSDEKQMIDSVRIVDVPAPSTAASTSASEIAEIASLISYSFGVNMDLVGSRPGTSSSGSGTAQRELHLLKNGQLSSDRVCFTDFFNNFVFRFNGYDPRFVMTVPYPTLTTLDNSKTGIKVISDNE